MSSIRFETSCQVCGLVRYFPTYWQARQLATEHWEETDHRVDVLGDASEGLRVLITISSAVTR